MTTTPDTVLVGVGSHGRDIQAIWKSVQLWHCQESGYWIAEPLHTFDDKDDNTPERVREVQQSPVILGVNNPIERHNLSKRFTLPALALVHHDAQLLEAATIKMGSVIAPKVLMLREVEIGQHTHVNYGTMMTRCTIGDFCTIGPGVTICGDVEIGDLVFIGAGAVIKDRITIGSGAVIGAGAVVVNDVHAGAKVVGVPARPYSSVRKPW